jgi:hypothetical protein
MATTIISIVIGAVGQTKLYLELRPAFLCSSSFSPHLLADAPLYQKGDEPVL